MARFTAATKAQLQQLRRSAPIVNPVDLGAVGGWSHTPEVFTALAGDTGTSAIVMYTHILQTDVQRRTVADAVIDSRAATGKPHAVLAPGGLTELEESRLREGGVPLFHETASCFVAIRCLMADGQPVDADGPVSPVEVPDAAALSALDLRRPLSEVESSDLLRTLGIPVIPTERVPTEDTAVAAAVAMGLPVAMKAVVPGIEHKSESGLVSLGLDS